MSFHNVLRPTFMPEEPIIPEKPAKSYDEHPCAMVTHLILYAREV